MDTRTYLIAQLDQLRAANRDHNGQAAAQVIAQLIRDDHPGARSILAGALSGPVEPRIG